MSRWSCHGRPAGSPWFWPSATLASDSSCITRQRSRAWCQGNTAASGTLLTPLILTCSPWTPLTEHPTPWRKPRGYLLPGRNCCTVPVSSRRSTALRTTQGPGRARRRGQRQHHQWALLPLWLEEPGRDQGCCPWKPTPREVGGGCYWPVRSPRRLLPDQTTDSLLRPCVRH